MTSTPKYLVERTLEKLLALTTQDLWPDDPAVTIEELRAALAPQTLKENDNGNR